MYTTLGTRLALKDGGPAQAVTQPVSMEASNAARADLVIFNMQGTVNLTTYGSNDLENWKQLTSTPTNLTVPGYYREDLIEDIGFAHIRLKVEIVNLAGGDFAILDLGVYTFEE